MAHQSGFGGSITTAGTTWSTLVTSTSLQRWSINTSNTVIEAYGKGEAWKTKFASVNEWDAEVEILIPDGVTPAGQLLNIGELMSLSFKINANDLLAGAGYVTGVAYSDPLDGPVTATLKITGTLALTPTVA